MTKMFRRWTSWLRGVYDDGQPIWLVLHYYSVHRQEDLKLPAAKLGINVRFTPPALTDEFQHGFPESVTSPMISRPVIFVANIKNLRQIEY
jgi:hypothetical protein